MDMVKIKKIIDELNYALEGINADNSNLINNVIAFEEYDKEAYITIKFPLNVVKEDDYIGFSFY